MTSVDAHAREARAERRWARRGASVPARFQHWLARSFPWAWRVRLDLIILFNFASWLLFLALAQIVAPTLIANARPSALEVETGFRLGLDADVASNVVTTVSILTALGFGVSWAFAVGKSARLRETARYAHQPGVILATLVFMSFASWIAAARVAPYVDTLRHPLYGEPIAQSIRDRLNDPAAPHVAALVCNAATTVSSERDTFLCALIGRARRADLFRAVGFEPSLEEWRAHPGLSHHYRHDVDHSYNVATHTLAQEIILFGGEMEPWRSRLASMRPWQRSADILEDPALIAAFARSAQFNRHIDLAFLFGRLDTLAMAALGDARESDAAGTEQRQIADALMSTPAFAAALHAAEGAFTGAAPAPAMFTADEWTSLSISRANAFLRFQAEGRTRLFATRPPPPAPAVMAAQIENVQNAPLPKHAALLLEQWRQQEADPVQHAAFVASREYLYWRESFLTALVHKGVLTTHIRAAPHYAAFAEHWRRTLMRPAMGPEAALYRELAQHPHIASTLAFSWSGAILAAIFLVCLSYAGLGGAFGALGLNGVIALVILLVGGTITSYTAQPNYWDEIWFSSAGCILIAAMFWPVALASLRRVRGRFTNFFAACAMWAGAIYAPGSLVNLLQLQGWGEREQFNAIFSMLAIFAANALVAILLVWFVTTLLTRAARFPRAA